MNTSSYPAANRRGQRRAFALTFILATGAVIALLAVGVIGFFRLSRDAQCLRNSLTAAMDSQATTWNKKLELSAGALTFGAVRAGLSFVEMDPQARTALGALSGAEVGIYPIQQSRKLDRAAMLAAADEAMIDRGWERVVGVINGRDLVVIYVPERASTSTKIRVCVAVLNRDELIVASTRGDLEPLIDLALSKSDWPQQRWLPVQM